MSRPQALDLRSLDRDEAEDALIRAAMAATMRERHQCRRHPER